MRTILLAMLAFVTVSSSVDAQTRVTTGPVTHLLAIGTVPADANRAALHALLPREVRETTNLYLQGRIDQWFSLADRDGVVFILDGIDPAQAQAMLDALPLGRAHLIRFEVLPLTPLAPLRLLTTSSASHQ